MTTQSGRPKRGTRRRAGGVEIDFLILADSAQDVNGKLYLMGGAFGIHNAKAYPSRFKFGVAAGLLLPQSQAFKEQEFKVKLAKRGEKPLLQGGGSLVAEATVGMEGPLRALIVFEAQILLPTPGTYEVTVEVSGATRTESFEALPPKESE